MQYILRQRTKTLTICAKLAITRDGTHRQTAKQTLLLLDWIGLGSIQQNKRCYELYFELKRGNNFFSSREYLIIYIFRFIYLKKKIISYFVVQIYMHSQSQRSKLIMSRRCLGWCTLKLNWLLVMDPSRDIYSVIPEVVERNDNIFVQKSNS